MRAACERKWYVRAEKDWTSIFLFARTKMVHGKTKTMKRSTFVCREGCNLRNLTWKGSESSMSRLGTCCTKIVTRPVWLPCYYKGISSTSNGIACKNSLWTLEFAKKEKKRKEARLCKLFFYRCTNTCRPFLGDIMYLWVWLPKWHGGLQWLPYLLDIHAIVQLFLGDKHLTGYSWFSFL